MDLAKENDTPGEKNLPSLQTVCLGGFSFLWSFDITKSKSSGKAFPSYAHHGMLHLKPANIALFQACLWFVDATEPYYYCLEELRKSIWGSV